MYEAKLIWIILSKTMFLVLSYSSKSLHALAYLILTGSFKAPNKYNVSVLLEFSWFLFLYHNFYSLFYNLSKCLVLGEPARKISIISDKFECAML